MSLPASRDRRGFPCGTVTRQVFLGSNLDTERIRADYEAGVLTLAIPVAEHAKPRRIEVTEHTEHTGVCEELVHWRAVRANKDAPVTVRVAISRLELALTAARRHLGDEPAGSSPEAGVSVLKPM